MRALKILGVIVGAVVVVIAAKTFVPYVSAEGSGSDTCAPQEHVDVASDEPAQWKLALPVQTTKLVVALEDWVKQARRGSQPVLVSPTAINKKQPTIPANVKLAAFLLASPSSGERSLQTEPIVSVTREPDGRSIRVDLCAYRDSSRSDPAGRYAGTVRIAGPRIASVDLPIEITVRVKRQNVALYALLVSILGALLAQYSTKDAEVSAEKIAKKPKTHFVLKWLPFASGLAAGLAAAFVIYADDPTWGAHLGSDVAKLLSVTFVAATGGLTVIAAPAKAAQERIAG